MASGRLKDLTERELLVLLNEKVDRLEQEVTLHRATTDKIAELEKQVIELRVKYQIWICIIGFLAGIGGNLFQKLINF